MARGLSRRELGLVTGGLGVGVSAGFALGYRMGQKLVWSMVDETIEEELGTMRKRYQALQEEMADAPKPDPEDLLRDYGDPARGEPVITTTPVEPRSVFDEEPPEDVGPEQWNQNHEEAQRTADVPYVISIDEFTQPPPEYDRMSVTWFEGDDTLIDGRDIPIDDMDTLVGIDNLEKFGHGSENPHTVYVRNEELKLDIEVTKSEGTLAEHVGVSPPPEEDGEMRHSADRRGSFDDER